jgi:abhydrolase domain-containing protein 12
MASHVRSFFSSSSIPTHRLSLAGKTLNLQLTTSDNVTLGAWLVLSDTFYHAQPTQPTAETLPALALQALQSHPTVLFLHGNAATRAVAFRVGIYAALSARLGANVLALDYRGFADSAGTPSEAGLARDARAAWDWLAAHGARPEDVLVVGHSLGTGVGARFVHELEVEQAVRPRGLVLLAPFSSIHTLLDTYYVLGLIPLMKPLELIPGARSEYWLCTLIYETLLTIPLQPRSSTSSPTTLTPSPSSMYEPPTSFPKRPLTNPSAG